MKIQPIDFNISEEPIRYEPVKPIVKSRFKRLFERQFQNVLRISAPEKPVAGNEETNCNKESSDKFEPSSVCLAKMVQNFMEENNEKQSAAVRCGRKWCNCVNGNGTDSSEDEFDSSGDASEILKSFVVCASVSERNLLADSAKIVEKHKISKRKDDFCRNIITDGLLALGYDASICKSRWDKSPSYPAGAYEYVDVIKEEERLIVDIDFKSEFEIARSTKTYKGILQTLPQIFVGKADRLQKIICIVSEAAKHSLQKKGMPVPPWRKEDYVKAKWLSPYTRITPQPTNVKSEKEEALIEKKNSFGEFELIFGEKMSPADNDVDGFSLSNGCVEEENSNPVVKPWEPPEIKPKSSQIGVKIVAGLASVFEDNNNP